jgi:hypothetical protein
MWQMKEGKFTWAYTRNMFSNIASGATPIGSAGRAPDDNFKFLGEKRRRKEDLNSVNTTIGREFILVKIEQSKDF